MEKDEQTALSDDSWQLQLLQLWKKYLKTEYLSIDDDFFEKGGDSVLAVELQLELQRLTGRELPESLLFEASTIRTLARRLSRPGVMAQAPIIRTTSGDAGAPLRIPSAERAPEHGGGRNEAHARSIGDGQSVRARNRATFEGGFGHFYSYMVERPWLGRAVGLAMWGGDSKPFYDSMRAIGELPDGAFVVDAPCGDGIAFKAVSPRQRLRYLALDLSPVMLERARQRALSLGLKQMEFVEGDAERIPVGSGSVDLLLSYWGLHCMPQPDAAVREITRCLRRGGRVIGAMICRGPSWRQRFFLQPGNGGFGPGGTVDELRAWLAAARLTPTRFEVSGAFAFFEASADN